MDRHVFAFVLLVFSVAATSAAPSDVGGEDMEEARYWKEKLRNLLERSDRVFDLGERGDRAFDLDERGERTFDLADREARAFECKQLGQGCNGIIPCCGSMQCFWRNGYSIRTDGECVGCVSSGQLCQRDSQCCSPLVCQKDNQYYVDGRCDAKRASGQECHEDDQCANRNCLISVWNKVKGHGGICA